MSLPAVVKLSRLHMSNTVDGKDSEKGRTGEDDRETGRRSIWGTLKFQNKTACFRKLLEK